MLRLAEEMRNLAVCSEEKETTQRVSWLVYVKQSKSDEILLWIVFVTFRQNDAVVNRQRMVDSR